MLRSRIFDDLSVLKVPHYFPMIRGIHYPTKLVMILNHRAQEEPKRYDSGLACWGTRVALVASRNPHQCLAEGF